MESTFKIFLMCLMLQGAFGITVPIVVTKEKQVAVHQVVLGSQAPKPLKVAQASAPPKKPVRSKATKQRVAHARELLGKHYKRSIVKVGENIGDLHAFVHQELEEKLPGKWKKKVGLVQRTIFTQSQIYRFDPIFLMAVIETESSFNPLAKGTFREIGLMQLKPETAQWIAKKYGIKWRGAKMLTDPVANIRIGAAYLDFLRGRFDFHSRLYIAAYNMGSTNVHRALDNQIWPKDYPARVMQHYIQDYSDLSALIHKTAPDHSTDSLLIGSIP